MRSRASTASPARTSANGLRSRSSLPAGFGVEAGVPAHDQRHGVGQFDDVGRGDLGRGGGAGRQVEHAAAAVGEPARPVRAGGDVIRRADRRPRDLDRIVECACAPDPDERFSNAQAVLDALDQRERLRSFRPLLALGGLGPLLLMFALGLFYLDSMRDAVDSATANLTTRAIESDVLSVEILARSVARELERRKAVDPSLPMEGFCALQPLSTPFRLPSQPAPTFCLSMLDCSREFLDACFDRWLCQPAVAEQQRAANVSPPARFWRSPRPSVVRMRWRPTSTPGDAPR